MLARSSLDTIMTLFSCLSYSTDFATISINSNEHFHASNVTCQAEFLNMLTTRMQNVINHNRQLTQEMLKLKAEITALKANIYNNNNESEKLPTNCVQQRSGVVTVKIDAASESINVVCEQFVNGGGWLLVAHRYNGSVDFNRNWSEYRIGFGNITEEFFLGLNKLYAFTQQNAQQLLISLEDDRGQQRYAHYSNFTIASAEQDFALLGVGVYSGNAGDALSLNIGFDFSTYDHHKGADCLEKFAYIAWWHSDDKEDDGPCSESILFSPHQYDNNEIHRIKVIKMFIRPSTS